MKKNEIHATSSFFFPGGSLTKIAYYSTVSHRKALYNHRKNDDTNSNKQGATSDPVLNGSSNCCETDRQIRSVSPKKESASQKNSPRNYEVHQTSRLHFIKFQTKYIESCLDFIQSHLVGSKEFMKGKSIKATGGGAYKYAHLIQEKLGLS